MANQGGILKGEPVTQNAYVILPISESSFKMLHSLNLVLCLNCHFVEVSIHM